MVSKYLALTLAHQTTPRYCDHCGSMNLWDSRFEVTGPDGPHSYSKRSNLPAWECAVCWGWTVLTTRAAKRLVMLDQKPRFRHKFRKAQVDTRKLVS